MVGNNHLMHKLRLLTSLELFLNYKYYFHHPILKAVYEGNKDLFSCYNVLFSICISNQSMSGEICEEIVIAEAKSNCKDKQWAPFLCALALSSISKRIIHLSYPSFGLKKYQLLFNQKIFPRETSQCSDSRNLNILFCSTEKIKVDIPFSTNHFVPQGKSKKIETGTI